MAENLVGHHPVKMHQRYGGLLQMQPLSEKEQLYDDTARAIDAMEAEIGGFSMGVFTAQEFMWFSYWVNKLRWGPTQEQQDRYLGELKDLRDKLQTRSSQAAQVRADE